MRFKHSLYKQTLDILKNQELAVATNAAWVGGAGKWRVVWGWSPRGHVCVRVHDQILNHVRHGLGPWLGNFFLSESFREKDAL